MLQSLCDLMGVGPPGERYGSVGKFAWQMSVRKGLKGSKEGPTGELIDFDKDFNVPSGYQGPRLDDHSKDPEISEDFVRSCLECFARNGVYTGTPASADGDKQAAPSPSPPPSPTNTSSSKKSQNPFKLHRKYVYRILDLVERHYRSAENAAVMVEVDLARDAVINVCGDVHGQFYDLLKIFRERGPPSDTNLYLFNGDIVDKGPMSLECILYLFLLKLNRPRQVFINRGNHECAAINARNGFAKEARVKSGGDHFLPRYFGEVFRWMPLCHLINGRILVMHGGLSANTSLKLADIRKIKKPADPRDGNLTGELLWSDPVNRPGVGVSSRGIGVFFGPDITKRFVETNDLLCIIRSHSEIKDGCGLNHEGCYTVYSAPSNAKGVKGGVLTIEGNFLSKEGNVFNECSREEVEDFKNCVFHKKRGEGRSGNDVEERVQEVIVGGAGN